MSATLTEVLPPTKSCPHAAITWTASDPEDAPVLGGLPVAGVLSIASKRAACRDRTAGETLSCQGCDEEFSLGDVEALVESWAKILPWLRQHPARQPQCAAVKVAG